MAGKLGRKREVVGSGKGRSYIYGWKYAKFRFYEKDRSNNKGCDKTRVRV